MRSRAAHPRLRLLACPGCGYDLRGSPAAGVCPECGLAYDERMFYLPTAEGWEPRSFTAALVLLAAVLAILSIIAFTRGQTGSSIFLGLIALTVMFATIGVMLRSKRRRRRWEIMRDLLADGEGLHWKRGLGGTLFMPWRRFANVEIRPVRRGLWLLTVSDRFLSINPASATVSVYLEATRREAAVMRNELRRRIRRARAPRERQS